jgi:hypothetical protein
VKFVLFVEGPTERAALPDFFKRWLDPQLSEPVGVRAVQFNGWSDYVRGIPAKANLNLSGKSGADVIAGIGLLDLYGPTFYAQGITTAVQKHDWARRYIEQAVNNPRFRQFFAVHETEAWLLSNPALLPDAVSKALPGRCARPEEVNFDEPPSDLLERLYRERLKRSYKKVIDGRNLFLDLAPQVARERCPYLRAMLDQMLELAQVAIGRN